MHNTANKANNQSFEQKFKEAIEAGHNIGACIRVQHGDTFLLVRRSSSDVGSGVYEMPGGSVDEGEELAGAAVRELMEETGIVISPDQLEPLGIFEFHNVETGKHKTKFAYSVHLDSVPTMQLSEDHDAAVFMTRDEIEALPRQGRDTEHVLWADHYNIVMR